MIVLPLNVPTYLCFSLSYLRLIEHYLEKKIILIFFYQFVDLTPKEHF